MYTVQARWNVSDSAINVYAFPSKRAAMAKALELSKLENLNGMEYLSVEVFQHDKKGMGWLVHKIQFGKAIDLR